MPDVTGYRAKVGVIAPSTNTVVEHDCSMLRPHGVTFHMGRMYIANEAMDSNENFSNLILQIRESQSTALRDVMTCKPDVMMMGMSGETFWGGVEGNRKFLQRVSDATGGLPISTGATAVKKALEALQVKRIAIFSPYQPVADDHVLGYFRESGFEVVNYIGLGIESATKIAQTDPHKIIATMRELDRPEVECIVQVGTNMSNIAVADQAEYWMGKPVIAINAAIIWETMRLIGIKDQWGGATRLLREF